MQHFDLNYLKYFYYVASLNGFTRAAEQLNVQQPVVSRAVKLLEKQLDIKLLERQKKQILLTEEGKQIFKFAQKVFSSIDEISNYSTDHQKDLIKNISFATSDSLGPKIIGSVLTTLAEKYPQLHPIHHSGPANLILEKISKGNIDFGIFFNVPELPSDLDKSILLQVPFEFVVLDKKAKDPKTLESFIASKEQDREHTPLPLFEKYKSFNKNVLITAISSSSIVRKDLTLKGLGITILPRFLVHEEIKNKTLKSLHKGSYTLPLYLVERKSSYRSKIKKILIDLIKESVDK